MPWHELTFPCRQDASFWFVMEASSGTGGKFVPPGAAEPGIRRAVAPLSYVSGPLSEEGAVLRANDHGPMYLGAPNHCTYAKYGSLVPALNLYCNVCRSHEVLRSPRVTE
jgi:hypothetical protein